MRVGATLIYCSKGCLFAKGLTDSYSTWTVIHTLVAPPKSISCLWRLYAQSSLAPESEWSRSITALGSCLYLFCRKFLTGAPIGWLGSQYRFRICWERSVRISVILFNWRGFVSGGCCSGECGGNESGAGGCVRNCVVFAAMSWKPRLIICLASTCS